MKKNKKMDVIIIPVDTLPTTNIDTTAWYFYGGEYYFMSNQTGSWVNKGGDRPEKPPVNP